MKKRRKGFGEESTRFQAMMFDMDPYDDKEVPCLYEFLHGV